MSINDIITLYLGENEISNTTVKKEFIDYIYKYNCIKRKYKNIKLKKFLIIYMASGREYLNAIFKINNFDGNIVLYCDETNNWYRDIINNIINDIKKYINELECTNIIIIGQSSGGYAALYLSTKINNSICLAFNPQTFQKINKLTIHNEIKFRIEPKHLIDIKMMIKKSRNNSKRYIFMGKSQGEAVKEDYFWMNTVSSVYMIDSKNTKLLMAPIAQHPLFKFVKYKLLYSTIINNYDILFNDIDKGVLILNKNIEYDIR